MPIDPQTITNRDDFYHIPTSRTDYKRTGARPEVSPSIPRYYACSIRDATIPLSIPLTRKTSVCPSFDGAGYE
jgi:hypothetical protein